MKKHLISTTLVLIAIFVLCIGGGAGISYATAATVPNSIDGLMAPSRTAPSPGNDFVANWCGGGAHLDEWCAHANLRPNAHVGEVIEVCLYTRSCAPGNDWRFTVTGHVSAPHHKPFVNTFVNEALNTAPIVHLQLSPRRGNSGLCAADTPTNLEGGHVVLENCMHKANFLNWVVTEPTTQENGSQWIFINVAAVNASHNQRIISAMTTTSHNVGDPLFVIPYPPPAHDHSVWAHHPLREPL